MPSSMNSSKDCSVTKCVCFLVVVQAFYIGLVLLLLKTSFWIRSPHESNQLRPIEVPKEFIRNVNISRFPNGVQILRKANDIMRTSKCYGIMKANNSWQELMICPKVPMVLHKIMQRKYCLVMATTFYHNFNKQFLFNNTVHNWASLLKYDVLPVLFLTDVTMLEQSGHLIMKACKLGWLVIMAPACTKGGYPIFKEMFNITANFKADWYGYSNGDILFTNLLINNLELARNNNFLFISGSRYNVDVKPDNKTLTLTEIYHLASKSKWHAPNAIDYFVFDRKLQTHISSVPPVAVGRPGYDNWLIWNVLVNNISSLDTTRTNPVLHMNVAGYGMWENSNRNTKDIDKEYNLEMLREWTYEIGFLNCLSNRTFFFLNEYKMCQNSTDDESLCTVGISAPVSDELLPAVLRQMVNITVKQPDKLKIKIFNRSLNTTTGLPVTCGPQSKYYYKD